MSYLKPVKFSKAKKILAASVELRGSYALLGSGMLELKAWLDERGISQSGNPFALFYDNPTEVPESQLRSEACIPVAKAFLSEGRFSFKEFPECRVAETTHEGKPEEYASTYGAFLEGLLKAGYNLAGPAREFYHAPASDLAPGMGWMIQQPISKRA